LIVTFRDDAIPNTIIAVAFYDIIKILNSEMCYLTISYARISTTYIPRGTELYGHWYHTT
jgi:hypothetical protein